MSIDNLKPKTLAGIKTLAKDLKRLNKLKHDQALNLAAQRAGYSNFKHAQKVLASDPLKSFKVKAGHITIYWTDDENQKSGRITLTFPLSQLISSLVTIKGAWADDSYFKAYRMEAEDHLERGFDASSSSEAMKLGRSAAYALQLMDMTGLRSSNMDFPKSVIEEFRTLEARDHVSWWVMPNAEHRWVVLDEPNQQLDRQAWAQSRQFAAKKCFTKGLYPGSLASTTVFSSEDELASHVVEALASIHADKEAITPEEGDYHTEFVSPYRVVAQSKRQPRTMPLPEGTIQEGSIAYGSLAGEASKWRPDYRLPISEHLKIGPVLAALLPPFDSDDEDPLHVVKYDLGNWLYLEHGDAITDAIDAAYDGYAGNTAAEEFITAESRIEAIEKVIQALVNGYPACKAVKIQVARMRKAQKRYSKMAAAI